MNWTVFVPRIPGYIHIAALQELVDAVFFGLRQLDARVCLSHAAQMLSNDTILIGAHLLSPDQCDLVPDRAIVYNTEHANSDWITAHYGALLRRVTVWDYSLDNAQLLESRLGHPVQYVPIGYVPEFTRITKRPTEDIDVLFCGSLSHRRMMVFEQLRSLGLSFHHAFGIYGAERDALISRARIVLNLHAYLPGAFEFVRVCYLLANRKAVVSEVNPNERIDTDLQGGFVAVPYQDIALTVARLAADAPAREAVAEAGFRKFASRDQAAILRLALGDRFGEPGARHIQPH